MQHWLEGLPFPGHSSENTPAYKEEERFFVTDLDQSQEAALLAVKDGQSLVIHGPPGTGKSQVIVNLIADAMAHGKKVLLVSQKRAALDVVHQRLKGLKLGQFTILVHDYRHDRKPIFQQLKQQIERLEGFQKDLQDLSLTKLDHDFKLFSRQLDQYSRKYEALNHALTESRRCGYRAHELYQRLPQGFQPWAELREVAHQLTQDQWVYLSRKLEQLLSYRDLLSEEHPWHQRLSFHRWQASDLNRLQELLPCWKAMVLDWHQAYQTLAPKFSSRLLDSQLNQERIEAFERANDRLQNHPLREGMEQLNLEGLSGEKALAQLESWEKTIQQLANRRLLHDGHWKYLADLEKHQEAYASWLKKPLRWLTLPFHQARWFFRKLAKTEGLIWEPSTFAQLSADLATMRSLRRRYGKYHEHAFWSDFPLLENQASKEDWLTHKQKAAQAYAEIRGLSFFKKIKPRFEKGKFLQQRWQESLRWLDQLKRFNHSRQHPTHPWQGWLHPEQIARFEAVVKEKEIPDSFHQYHDELEASLKRDFFDLRDLDKLIHSLTPEENKLVRNLAGRWTELDSPQEFIDQVERSLLLFWLEECEAQSPILQEVSSRSWAGELKQFEEILAERQKLVATLVQHRLKERMVEIVRYNRLKNPITYREINHQVSKKRRLWSMRKLIAQTWNQGLERLAPCWLASPESAAALFPLEADFFDLVIFDEASQCLVERALPIALRAKQCIVAGDAQQLRPFDLYRVRYEDSEEEFVENEKALEVESLLDLAQLSLPEVKLNWHYRSENQALINYSNQAFYEGKLEFLPYAQPDSAYQPALEWISVAGTWENNQNLAEAQAVVNAMEKLTSLELAPTLGVVTFNYRQQQLISDLIDQKLEWLAQHDEAGYAQLWGALNRKTAEEWQGIFVKNIENVQGDEREIILFSLAYGPDPSGRLSMNFGLLNQAGGENRLNVAITRAKKKVMVFSSFQPHQLEVEQSAHAGPRHFKNYLSY
ncbi:MAG: AAA domain-containing protein, partial [Bacteroidota bacterium]